MSLAQFFTRRPGPNYTCWNLACEVWRHLTGQDISGALQSISLREAGALKRFTRLPQPASPCICLFQGAGHRTHCGVFVDGRVLHLAREGVHHMPISTVMLFGFRSVKFYAAHNN